MLGVKWADNSYKHVSSGYMDTHSMFCPSTTSTKNWVNYSCYGLNWSICTRRLSYTFSSLKDPSKKIINCETARHDSSAKPDGYGYHRWSPGHASYTDSGWGFPATRHNSQCNTLHVDGHVQQFRVPNASAPCAAFPFANDTASKEYSRYNF